MLSQHGSILKNIVLLNLVSVFLKPYNSVQTVLQPPYLCMISLIFQSCSRNFLVTHMHILSSMCQVNLPMLIHWYVPPALFSIGSLHLSISYYMVKAQFTALLFMPQSTKSKKLPGPLEINNIP